MTEGYAVLIPFSSLKNAERCAEKVGYATYIVRFRTETRPREVFVAEEVK